MRRHLREYGFPVLGKELLEQAERKRTYLTRVIFALFLSVAFLISYGTIHTSGNRLQDLLGRGRQIFSFLIQLQLAAIYLYVPALMSGAVAGEKERNSLSLLLLTRLRAGEIILEKLFGRLTPVFTLQFISLPLLAVAYSLGGVSTTYFWSCIYLLFLACLQVGAFALFLSAWCRTTVAAFALSYLLTAAFGLGSLLFDDSDRSLASLAFLLWTPAVLERVEGTTFPGCALMSMPALATVAGFLLLARRYLFLRIDMPARNYSLQVLRGIDRIMNAVNRRFGNIVLFPDRSRLPRNEPIAWREVEKKSLGKPQYVVRMLLALQIPSVVVALVVSRRVFSQSAFRGNYEIVTTCVFVLWGVVVLILGVLGTNLVVSERTQQTLGVLLATPISRSDIIRQKTRGLARLIKLLWIPFLTLFLFGAWVRSGVVRGGEGREPGLYFLASCATMLIYLPLLGWLATYLGLRSHNRLAAFTLYLACITIWSAPPLMSYLGGPHLGGSTLLLSPLTMVLVAEASIGSGPRSDLFSLWAIALNAALYGCILYRVRGVCLTRAERHLHSL